MSPRAWERSRRLDPRLSATGRRGRSRWVLRLALAAGGLVGLTVFAAVEHTRPRPLPTLLFVLAVVALLGLVADSSGAAPADWHPDGDLAATSSGQDGGLAGNVRLIENHLSAREPDPLLPARLARLATDRLTRLGLSRGDPEVVRRLGPTLTSVLGAPERRLTRAEIEECLRRIEELSA